MRYEAPRDFEVPVSGPSHIRVIEVVPNQIVTRQSIEKPKVEQGKAVPDVERDILKLVVLERHRATGNVGVGFVRGFKLQAGALASTVAHDAHNVVAVGVMAAFAGMPQPEMTPGKEMTTHGFEVSGLATGRDTLGRLGLTIAVSGNAVTFVVPPEHEATLRAAVVETAPPPPGEKPN